MRPKKIVYVYSADEETAADLRYVIDLRVQYRASAYLRHKDLLAAMLRRRPDALVAVVKSIPSGIAVLKAVEAFSDELRAVVMLPRISRIERPTTKIAADWILARDRLRLFELLQVITKRKPGPRKGFKKARELQAGKDGP